MSKTNDLELNWDQLERESLTHLTGDFQVSDKVEVGSAVPLRDRLSELYLNGFFPLLAVAACAFLLASYQIVSVALLGVGVLAPLVAWLVRPFLLNGGSVTARRLLIWAIPLLFLACLVSVVPNFALRLLQGDFSHPALGVSLLQAHLESALSPVAFTLFLLTVCASVYAMTRIRAASPWCEPKISSRFAVAWRQILGALVILSIVMSLWSYRPLTAEENRWVKSVGSELKSQPYFYLPETGSDRFWRTRFENLQATIRKVSSDGKSGNDFTPNGRRLISKLQPVQLDLDSHPPTSKEEYDACDYYYFRQLVISDEKPDVHFIILKHHFQSRPTGDSIYTLGRLPKIMASLATREAELNDLKRWLESVKELQGLLFTREMELDSEVYRQLVGWNERLEPEDAIGWQLGESVEFGEPDRRKHVPYYQGKTAPRDLRALGLTFKASPTRLFARAQSRHLLRKWLSMREDLLTQDLSEQITRFERLRDSLGHAGTAEYQLWSRMSGNNLVVAERRGLQTCELILSLRIFRAENGRFPTELSELGLDWARSDRYRWKAEAQPCVLIDELGGWSFTLESEAR